MGEDGSVVPREWDFGRINDRGSMIKDWIWRIGINGLGDGRGVELGNCEFEIVRR